MIKGVVPEPNYLKYQVCDDEQEYENIQTKDPDTLYLILEEETPSS